MFGLEDGDDVFAAEGDFIARLHANQVAHHPPAIQILPTAEHPLDVVAGGLGNVDGGRVHLHHSPPCDVHRQCGHVVEMGVRNEERLCSHERPGAATQVEPEFQFGNSPVRLHGRPGITFNG